MKITTFYTTVLAESNKATKNTKHTEAELNLSYFSD